MAKVFVAIPGDNKPQGWENASFDMALRTRSTILTKVLP